MHAATQFCDTTFEEPFAWPALEPERVPESRHPIMVRAPVRAAAAARASAAQLRPENVDPRSLLGKEPLSATTRGWMRDLPFKMRPGLTAQRHPHVLNRLALVWGDVPRVAELFQHLLLSSRIDRKGFALEVMEELLTLQAFSKEPRRR
ncbi:MAG: hypothetical protein ABI574_09660 [Burkholderiales bacterium]